ncbi:MAG: hypothetical protein Q4A16_04875 [Lautropia sp.]|nr:hypothetical protein [Lautropia sp.]
MNRFRTQLLSSSVLSDVGTDARRLLRRIPAALSLALGCGVLLAACGSTPQGPRADYSNASALSSQGTMRSPASERVVGGIVETVLSDRLVDDFDEAARHKPGVVRDGQPLYLYLRSNRPLGELAHPVDPYSPHSFSAYPHLFVQIGDNQSMRILSTCYVTLTPAEAKGNTLVLPLAPLTTRVGNVPSDCWLETMTQAEPIRQVFEVRLAGFPGRFESWLPVPDLLAVDPVEVDLSRGAGRYAGMLRAEPGKAPSGGLRGAPASDGEERIGRRESAREAAATAVAKREQEQRPAAEAAGNARQERMQQSRTAGATMAGTAAMAASAAGGRTAAAAASRRAEAGRSTAAPTEATRKAQTEEAARLAAMPAGARLQPVTPLLPARPQSIGGPRMAQQLNSLTSTLLGREPSETYFIDRQWQSQPGRRGQRDARQTMRAIAVFRGAECSWQSLLVSRRPASSTLSEVVLDGDEVQIPCPDLER